MSDEASLKVHLPTPAVDEYTITFNTDPRTEIMRLDGSGMTYKGQRIEDAGEAHRAFLEVMRQMQSKV